ncbi:hypothetical protein [Kitasatospora albolonga]|uniref:hypothetical protein n=1 Tax=Kitasatospora albolonga TaxID=68173 RepID=UPI0031E8A55A
MINLSQQQKERKQTRRKKEKREIPHTGKVVNIGSRAERDGETTKIRELTQTQTQDKKKQETTWKCNEG